MNEKTIISHWVTSRPNRPYTIQHWSDLLHYGGVDLQLLWDCHIDAAQMAWLLHYIDEKWAKQVVGDAARIVMADILEIKQHLSKEIARTLSNGEWDHRTQQLIHTLLSARCREHSEDLFSMVTQGLLCRLYAAARGFCGDKNDDRDKDVLQSLINSCSARLAANIRALVPYSELEQRLHALNVGTRG